LKGPFAVAQRHLVVKQRLCLPGWRDCIIGLAVDYATLIGQTATRPGHIHPPPFSHTGRSSSPG